MQSASLLAILRFVQIEREGWAKQTSKQKPL
jgi:hypothetical protein